MREYDVKRREPSRSSGKRVQGEELTVRIIGGKPRRRSMASTMFDI